MAVPRAVRSASPGVLPERLAGKRICICAGAGGVGKTTISAALALGLAREGRRVVVITVDPARRLAGALGIAGRRAPAQGTARTTAQAQPGEPVRVRTRLPDGSAAASGGELWAVTLDVPATFDELLRELAPQEDERAAIRENRIYRELSSAVAGSHEIAAAAKLYELHREPAFDVIVLDTPPSRNALDFLDAPTRLAGFLEGRALGMVLAAGGLSSGPGASLLPRLVPRSALTRLLGGSSALLLSMFARATGVEMVGDLALFFRLLAPMSDALRERARAVEALLRDQATAFLIVTSPESEPVREARFLHEQLTQLSAPYAALIVNRLHALEAPRNPEALRPLLNDCLGDGPAARVLANLADVSALARRDRESLAVLSAALREPHPVSVPELGGEIDDLAGLAALAEHLLA